MNILPMAVLQFLDNNGQPLTGGFVYTYAADGATPKLTYQDVAGQIPNANPVALDANGRASIWGTGPYVWNLQDQYGNTIWTSATEDLTQSLATMFAGSAAPTTSSSGLSSLSSVWWHDTGTNTIWLRDAANTTWIEVGTVNEVAKTFSPYIGNIANVNFTGAVTAPTQAYGDDSTLVATDAFVQTALSLYSGNSAPARTNVYYPGTYSWVCPASTNTVMVTGCAGGGGGGGGLASSTGGGGGGGGQCLYKYYVIVSAGTSYPITVGLGGAGGAPNTTGSAGGTTSFGSSLVLNGGLGGISSGGGGNGGAPGGPGGTSGQNGDIMTNSYVTIIFGGFGGNS